MMPSKNGGPRRVTAKKVEVSITEVTLFTGKKEKIHFNVDDERVEIEVAPEIKAYFNEQFYREKPTKLQSKRFATLMSLLRAAYRAGKAAN